MKRFDGIVIGGGAAGMMAAGCAAQRGKRVLVLEKNNSLGEKLIITGGGRCNITNAQFNERLLLKNYGNAASFLFSSFSQFGVQDTFDFFQSHGLPFIVEEGNRAFPSTQRATDVRRVLEKYMKDNGVTVKTGARVTHIRSEGGVITGVDVNGIRYNANAVILATGGTSHPETGSTGDGFAWLRTLGHTVHAPTPSIVPLEVAEESIRELAGVSMSGVKITYYAHDKKAFSRKGNLLFTHFGISGPVVLNSSGKVADLLHEGRVSARIDFFPEENERELDERIIELFDQNKNKVLRNIFNLLAPQQLLSCMKGISGEERVHSITKEQRRTIVLTLKALPLTITRLMGLDRAVVVDGGVDLKEIHNKTMRSTLYDNLYIVGDLLDINRPSGGFSLQLCWTTGWVAGSYA